MNITFYSTNSCKTQEEGSPSQVLFEIPSSLEYWTSFAESYPEIEIRFVVQFPGRFLLDNGKASSKIKLTIISEEASAEEIAEVIASESVDLAVPVTFWTPPYDWLSLKDSLIASILNKKGIKTACHSEKTSLICYDKKNTADFLKKNNLNCAKSVFLDFQMFRTELSHRELSSNVYKEFILAQIQKLTLPLVVKNTSGLSSWGMDVCKTLNETFHVLNSKKTNGNRLIEEFLSGPSFGIEIYGSNKKYSFSPLLINSVNQFGLTSPKQNVKLGPVTNPNFRLNDLYRDLERLAALLDLNGIAQVDLVFHDSRWYIIEINSRISGMTETAAAAMNLSLPELLIYSSFLGKNEFEETSVFKKIAAKKAQKNEELYSMNMKFPLLSEEKLKKLSELYFVKKVNQIENLEAKQLREQGYSEIIFGGFKTLEELMDKLEELKSSFGDYMEKVFYENALKLKETILE